MILLLARTTDAAVKTVLGPNYDSDNLPSLDPFLEWAYSVVTRVATAAAEEGATFPAADAELMERYLAAHAYTAQDPLYTSRSTSGASGSFIRDPKGDYLKLAQAIDPTGALLAVMENNRAGAFWAGTTESAATDWADRN